MPCVESAAVVSDPALGAHLDEAGVTVVLARSAPQVRRLTSHVVVALDGDAPLDEVPVAGVDGRCVGLVEPRRDGWWVVVTAGRPLPVVATPAPEVAPPPPPPAPPPPPRRPYKGPGGSFGLGVGFPAAFGFSAALDYGPVWVEGDAGAIFAVVVGATSASVRAGARLPAGQDGHWLVVGGGRVVTTFDVFSPETTSVRAAELAVGFDHALTHFSAGQTLIRLEVGADAWLERGPLPAVTPLVAMGIRWRFGGPR